MQAAARAFENALDKGKAQAEEAARKKFTDKRGETTWEQLKQLGREIVKQYRIGKEMTFDTLMNACENTPQYAPVLSSVSLTIKDPSYLAQLEAANDLNHVPAPKRPRRKRQPRRSRRKPPRQRPDWVVAAADTGRELRRQNRPGRHKTKTKTQQKTVMMIITPARKKGDPMSRLFIYSIYDRIRLKNRAAKS